MSIARSALVVGPARCIFTPNSGSAATFFTNDAFEVKLNTKRFEIQPQGFTQSDQRDEDRTVEFDVTPDGRWNSTIIAALWPYLNSLPGLSMPTNTDKTFIAHGADGGLLTVIASYLKKMPNVTLSAKKSMIGSAGFKGIVGSDMDPEDANSYLTYSASGGTIVDTAFSLAAIKTQPYSAAWGSVSGFESFYAEDGFEISFDMQSKEIQVDGLGTVGEVLQKVGVMVKCKPVGPTAAQILTALRFQGATNSLGRSHQAGGAALTITGGLDSVNIFTSPKMSLVEAGYRFGNDVLRNGEVGFVANINPAAGVQGAIATLAAA